MNFVLVLNNFEFKLSFDFDVKMDIFYSFATIYIQIYIINIAQSSFNYY